MMKSNPILAGWVTHKLENKNTKGLSHYCEDSGRPHIRLPGLGGKVLGIPGNLVLKSSGIRLQELYTPWEKQETALLEHKESMCAGTQKKGTVAPMEDSMSIHSG